MRWLGTIELPEHKITMLCQNEAYPDRATIRNHPALNWSQPFVWRIIETCYVGETIAPVVETYLFTAIPHQNTACFRTKATA